MRWIIGLTAGLFMGCVASDGSSLLGSALITEEEEIAVGKQVHADLMKGYTEYPDPIVKKYVRDLGLDLVARSQRPHLEHHFYVLDSTEINAFAAPGGYVYVTTGLMSNLNSRAELAGVMGHEVGHVSARHGARTMQSQFVASALSGLLLGEGSSLGEVVKWTTDVYLNTGHSRDMEREADTLAIDFSHGAGYNPWRFVDFFTFLDTKYNPRGTPDPTAGISKWLSSHPQPLERVANTKSDLEKRGIKKDDATLIVDDANDPFRSYIDIKALLPPQE